MVADDSRYFPGIPIQSVSASHYSIDSPSWITGTETYPFLPRDLQFNEPMENLYANIETSDLSLGKHTIFIESQDADGNWGVNSAIFFHIESDGYAPRIIVPKSAQYIHPGSTLTQTIELINYGIMTDTFNISITGSSWDTSVDREQVGPLAAGESSQILLRITAPLSIEDSTFESVTLTVNSINDPTKYVDEDLVFVALLKKLYIPFVLR